MAENIKDPIDKLAESRNVPREEIVKELRELDLGAVQPDGKRSGGFAELYEKGIFLPGYDRAAHEAFGKALGSDQDLFRAFDYYKRINSGGKGVQEILKEAGDSYGAAKRRAMAAKMPWNGDVEGDFKQFLYGPYNFTQLSDGTYVAPWLKEQAQEKIGPPVQESDAERKERQDREEIEDMKAKREEQKAQAQALALDRDPEARMLRMQNAQAQNNPFLFGTEGVSAQTDRFLDVAGREKPFRNYSDARMRAKQDLDMDSRAFVAGAARENIRELDRLDRGRRATVDNNFENMMQWTVNNSEHEMAKKGPNNWTDQEKIKFVQALNLGKINLDEPAAAAAAPAPAPAAPAAPAPQAPMAQAPAPQAQAPAPQAPAPAPAPAAQAPVTIDDPAKADLVDSRYKLPAYSQQVPPAPETKEGFTVGLEIPGHRVFDYDPNTPPHPGGAGRGRSGKKQFNIPALEFLNLNNYTAREVPIETVKKSPMTQPPMGMPAEMTVNERFPKQPTLDEPDSALPPQDPFNSKPAYNAENAQQDYNKLKSMRDLDEAKRVNQLNSQIQLTNMQKSKAQNIADTKAYWQNKPDSVERSIVMDGINNSKSGDFMQDWMDSRKEEDERKRRQQQFVTASKNSPYYTNYYGS